MADDAVLEVSVVEQHFPRYDPAHGTPDPMVRRMLTLTSNGRTARFEQTDYGHPGRFNPWDARGIDASLQPRTPELKTVCDAVTPLLG